MMIYLDNAATTIKKPQEVIDAVVSAMNTIGNAGRGATNEALMSARIIYDTREKLCRFLNAKSTKEIVFTHNATESLNTAIKGLLNLGDHCITTMLEHNSVLRPLYELENDGLELSIVNSDRLGNLLIDEIESLIKPNTKAIITTHASNVTGNIVDLDKLSYIAKKHNLLFIVDASQTVGVIPIDVQSLNIDVLCFTGHKSLLGPQGTGGMYVREGINIRPLKSGGSGINSFSKNHPIEMPTRLEAGTLNGHGIAGLGAALSYIERVGLDNIRKVCQGLSMEFYQGIKDIPGVTIYGDFSTKNRCPIVSLNIYDFDSSLVSDELLIQYNISTRPGAHCAPLMHEALGTKQQGAVRFSFSHHNTKEEVSVAVKAIKMLSKEL